MRQDQLERLQALAERLIEIAIHDLDPDNWPGAGKLATELTAQERGDAYWTRKLGTSTVALTLRTLNLIEYAQDPALPAPPSQEAAEAESDMDADIRATEQTAARLMARLTSGPNAKPGA